MPGELTEKVSILKGSPQEVLEQIHAKGFYKLYIDGGVTVQNFLKADLIDEMTLTTIPILLGGGISLFVDMPEQLEFQHVESRVFIDQIVQDTYTRKR